MLRLKILAEDQARRVKDDKSEQNALYVKHRKLWSGKTRSIKHVNVFGARAYVLIKGHSNGKFKSKSEESVLVAYSNECKAYRLLSPRTGNIIISRDVKIHDQMYFSNEYIAKSKSWNSQRCNHPRHKLKMSKVMIVPSLKVTRNVILLYVKFVQL